VQRFGLGGLAAGGTAVARHALPPRPNAQSPATTAVLANTALDVTAADAGWIDGANASNAIEM
jgi:hypothetical protein